MKERREKKRKEEEREGEKERGEREIDLPPCYYPVTYQAVHQQATCMYYKIIEVTSHVCYQVEQFWLRNTDPAVHRLYLVPIKEYTYMYKTYPHHKYPHVLNLHCAN